MGVTRAAGMERSGEGRGGEMGRWALAFAAALLLVPIALVFRPGTDQTLFLDYAAEMLGGARLYVDVWDNKQPGIFALYAAIQAALGPGWDRVLIGYAAWMCAAAATAALVVRMVAPAASAIWLAAVPFTLGVVWLRSGTSQVAQIEEWVALPLTAILMLALRPEAPGLPARGRWFAIGLLAGGVSLLKLVLAPVPVAIAAAVFVARMRADRLPVRHLVAALAWATAGVALVWLPTLAWFAANGTWDAFWWTNFDYPRLAMTATERAPWRRLVASMTWLGTATLPMWPAILLAVVGAWRAPRSTLARLVAGAIAWWVAGLAMIVAQKFSWWGYHMLLLVWPMGVLAAAGCAAAWGEVGRSRWASRVAVAVCAAGLAVFAGHVAWKLWRGTDWPYSADTRAVKATARELGRAATPACGTSVTIGDQNGLQAATGLRRAMATNAVFWGAYLPSQIERLPAELRRARPDLVFMDADQRDHLAAAFPAVLAEIEQWLARDYVSRGTDAMRGRWWERAPSARDGTCPAREPFAIPGR
ncbi:MAG: hypothetical protein WCK28_16905 [Burkholderiales bacterium]|jgi:hypothetical protein